MNFARDIPPTSCDECGSARAANELALGGRAIAICWGCTHRLTKILPRRREPRTLNRKQYSALAVIQLQGHPIAKDVLIRAMGQYATNSFNSCVERGLICELEGDRYDLTAKGRDLVQRLGATG